MTNLSKPTSSQDFMPKEEKCNCKCHRERGTVPINCKCCYEIQEEKEAWYIEEFDYMVNNINFDAPLSTQDYDKYKALLHKVARQTEEKMIEKYNELIMAVEKKHEGETRHETALRYIKQAESSLSLEAKENEK